MSNSASDRAPSPNDFEPGQKRRRVRKGTTSCWACKKRKVRCEFDSLSDTTCINCRQRGSTCVSQDHPDQDLEDQRGQIGDRIVRVEALLSQLVKETRQNKKNETPTYSEVDTYRKLEAPTPFSDSESTICKTQSGCSPATEFVQAATGNSTGCQQVEQLQEQGPLRFLQVMNNTNSASKYKQLSKTLFDAFPSQRDIDFLIKSGSETMVYFQHLNTKPHNESDHDEMEIDPKYWQIPSADSHPVLLANRLLMFTIFIQQLPRRLANGLSKHPQVMVNGLADAARLVTTQEELLGTLDGLECIMLEGFYQTNCGNLRRAWLSFKRAISVAQLMGMDRLAGRLPKSIDTNSQRDPQYMCFRIIYIDRLLSLLLGLPQGDNDVKYPPDMPWADDSPLGRLERAQAMISARIIQRNQSDPLLQDLEVTKDIDADLLKAAKIVPSDFWFPPDFSSVDVDHRKACCEARRVMLQIFHYCLLNHLHLPYLIQFNNERKCLYSKVVAVNSSREILTRFIAFRHLNHITTCCRLGDFIAITAGMTLLLAHLDSHKYLNGHNFLAHQRLADRAMMERVLENMEMVSKLNEDVLTVKSADLLRRLLKIEAEAADGNAFSAEKVSEDHQEDESNVLKLYVPYFGTIRIAREGIASSRAAPWTDFTHSQNPGEPVSAGVTKLGPSFNPILASELPLQTVTPHLNAELNPIIHGFDERQQNLYPGIAASLDDWTFQGVDAAFFDSLMRGQTIGSPVEQDGQNGYHFGMNL